jgi:hypothetical protein
MDEKRSVETSEEQFHTTVQDRTRSTFGVVSVGRAFVSLLVNWMSSFARQ